MQETKIDIIDDYQRFQETTAVEFIVEDYTRLLLLGLLLKFCVVLCLAFAMKKKITLLCCRGLFLRESDIVLRTAYVHANNSYCPTLR